MRGSPIQQAIFMVVIFALVGVPVWRLTRPAMAAAVVVSAPEMSTAQASDRGSTSLEVGVEFAPAPMDFVLKNLDQTVLSGKAPGTRFATAWTTGIPPEGLDLVLQAHWREPGPRYVTEGPPPAVTPAAARITVKFPDGRQVEKSFWAATDGTLQEVLTVPGPAATPTP